MQKLSTLNVGQANHKNSGKKAHVEYLGEGGFMELKSNYTPKKIVNYVSSGDSIAHSASSQWYFAEICEDYLDLESFESAPEEHIIDYGDVLRWCVNTLESSPSARLMLKEACAQDWTVSLDDLNGGEYCVDVDQKLLIIDHNGLLPTALGASGYFRNATLAMLVKALRDIWQEKRHGGFDEQYSPDNVLLMERVRAADLDVLLVLVAWELRSEEYSDLWRHLIGSEIGDIAMSFSGYLEREPSSAFNGLALRNAFKQWFRDEARINSCDHDALEYMDDVLNSSVLRNPFGRKKPTKMNVEILSCLPDKTAYLQGYGGEILSDPSYAMVNDEINQTHLFHIMYDLEATIVENVPFRDAELARKIFPIERD